MNGIQLAPVDIHQDGATGTFQNHQPPDTPGTIYVNVKDAAGIEVANVSTPAPNTIAAPWATLPWEVAWSDLPAGTYEVTAVLAVPGAPAPCPTVVKSQTFVDPPPSEATRSFDGAQLIGGPHGFDQVNYDVTRDTTVLTPNGQPTARCRASGSQHIARCNWFAPEGAGYETGVIAQKGDTIAHGGYFRCRSGDPHPWTQCLRLSNNDSSAYGGSALGSPFSVLAVRLTAGKAFVDLSDYGDGGPTGVPDSTLISDAPFPIDGQWRYLELVALLDNDPAQGWAELWINETLAAPRKTGRTLKLATSLYRREQQGLGDYYNPGGASAEVHVGDSYIDEVRRGPS